MKAKVVKKYKDVFDWWLEDYENRSVCMLQDGVWRTKKNPYFVNQNAIYIINDKYVEQRKECAELGGLFDLYDYEN